jgi:hypothetical protein
MGCCCWLLVSIEHDIIHVLVVVIVCITQVTAFNKSLLCAKECLSFFTADGMVIPLHTETKRHVVMDSQAQDTHQPLIRP